MNDESSCLLKEQKPIFKKMLQDKIKALEEEEKSEVQFFETHGLFNVRDSGEIFEEIDVAKKVLKNLDVLPECPA